MLVNRQGNKTLIQLIDKKHKKQIHGNSCRYYLDFRIDPTVG